MLVLVRSNSRLNRKHDDGQELSPCPGLAVSVSQLSPGSWSLSLDTGHGGGGRAVTLPASLWAAVAGGQPDTQEQETRGDWASSTHQTQCELSPGQCQHSPLMHKLLS